MQIRRVKAIEVELAVGSFANRAEGNRAQSSDLAQRRRNLSGPRAEHVKRPALDKAAVVRKSRDFGRDDARRMWRAGRRRRNAGESLDGPPYCRRGGRRSVCDLADGDGWTKT